METHQNYGADGSQLTSASQMAGNGQSIRLDNPATIRAYFEKIRALQQSGECYPVDLDEVWPLVYSRKQKAVQSLRKSFFEGHHYEVFTQPGKNPSGGRPEVTYRMTVACMEHFVACKVHEVFEVYRIVFNQVMIRAAHPPQPDTPLTRKQLALLVIQSEEERERLEHQLASAQPKVDYVDQVLDTAECVVSTVIASELGYSAVAFNRLLKEQGIQWKVDGVWVLTSKYAGRGYSQMRTHVYTGSAGESHTTMLMVWTQRGRAMLHHLFKNRSQQQLPLGGNQ